MAASSAAGTLCPDVSPSQAAALFEEADAAYQRCKKVLPPDWGSACQKARSHCSLAQPVIQAHLLRSPERWQRGIAEMPGPAFCQQFWQKASDLVEKAEAGYPTCDACGRQPAMLKKCSVCKQRSCVSEGGAWAGLGDWRLSLAPSSPPRLLISQPSPAPSRRLPSHCSARGSAR